MSTFLGDVITTRGVHSNHCVTRLIDQLLIRQPRHFNSKLFILLLLCKIRYCKNMFLKNVNISEIANEIISNRRIKVSAEHSICGLKFRFFGGK